MRMLKKNEALHDIDLFRYNRMGNTVDEIELSGSRYSE